MKKISLHFISVLLLAGAFIAVTAFAGPDDEPGNIRENTPGTVSFTVTTKPAGGNYAPRHVLAVWIEKDGEFVKTRLARANQRKQYLYTWRASSNYNVVDAITGPTLNSHQTHNVEWDCTDLNGDVVADGTYTLRIEFTDKHAQGPLYSIDFMKGTEPVTITPPNQQYFTDMELTYTPDITVAANFTADVTQACMGDAVVFEDNSTGATSWFWNFGEGANPQTAMTQGPHTVSYGTAGSKTISLTINGNVTETKTGYINIDPVAVAGFDYEQLSRTVTFNNTSSGAVAYAWDFGDGNSSTLENPEHTYADDGTFAVSLTATSENCGDDVYQETIVINTVGLAETPAEKTFCISPNPASGSFTITLPDGNEAHEVVILDEKGNRVWHQNAGGRSVMTIKTQSILKPGVYFIKVSGKDNLAVQKLLIR